MLTGTIEWEGGTEFSLPQPMAAELGANIGDDLYFEMSNDEVTTRVPIRVRSRYRITIPKEEREVLDLSPGDEIYFQVVNLSDSFEFHP